MYKFLFGVYVGIGYTRYQSFRRFVAFTKANPDHPASIEFRESVDKMKASTAKFKNEVATAWERAKINQKFEEIVSTFEENN